MLPRDRSPVRPVEPVTELTEGAVEISEVGITEPRVVLRVALDAAADAVKTNTHKNKV